MRLDEKDKFLTNLSCSEYIKNVIRATPAFNQYKVSGGVISFPIMSATTRPANLFYNKLNLDCTNPGEKLFRINNSLTENIEKFDDKDELVISSGKAKCQVHQKTYKLQKLFGKGEYHISISEVKDILKSQKIFLTSLLPLKFFMGLKHAMKSDGIILLPGKDRSLYYLKDFLTTNEYSSCRAFITKVFKEPATFGFDRDFEDKLSFAVFKELNLYQIGSLLVKTESYRCFIDDNYQICNRSVGDKDDILLINSCGIRGFHSSTQVSGNEEHDIDKTILTNMYQAAITSVGEGGFYILPALGMGVWGGIPEIYWDAFLSAVVNIEVQVGNIFVSPAHQERRGYRGQEFETYLKGKLEEYPNNNNLGKIINLYELKTDVVLLAKHLKAKFPERVIGLQNASDPDVTLGFHVGEYVNNLHHSSTTEEHYTAIGTNGINFERFTGVLRDCNRVVSLQT